MWHLHVRQSILIQGDEIFVWAIKAHYKQNRSDFKLYTKNVHNTQWLFMN